MEVEDSRYRPCRESNEEQWIGRGRVGAEGVEWGRVGGERGLGVVGKMYNYSQDVREGAIGKVSDAVNTVGDMFQANMWHGTPKIQAM